VTEQAEQLQRSDPDLWKELVGRPLADSTIKSLYWGTIDPARKAEAKERFERSRKTREV
jgi:hypothetical protein